MSSKQVPELKDSISASSCSCSARYTASTTTRSRIKKQQTAAMQLHIHNRKQAKTSGVKVLAHAETRKNVPGVTEAGLKTRHYSCRSLPQALFHNTGVSDLADGKEKHCYFVFVASKLLRCTSKHPNQSDSQRKTLL